MIPRSKKFFFHIIIALIAISFIATGIGGVSLRNYNIIATVGKKEITRAEFEQAKEIEYNQISQMLGGEVPEFYQKQLESIILNKVIVQKMLDNFISYIGLTISDSQLAEWIKSDELFYDNNKKFSREVFLQFVKQNHLSERQYLDIIKSRKLKELLINHIIDIPVIDDKIQQKLSTKIGEELHCDFYTLENTKKDFDISQKEVEQYYEQFKDSFYEEEKRSFLVAEITQQHVKDIEVSDEEISNYYQDNKDEFASQSSRNFLNVVFPTQEEAKDFYNVFTKAEGDYKQVLRDMKHLVGSDKDYIMQDVFKEALVSELSNQVFEASTGQIIEPIKSPLGWHVIKILQVNPPSLKSLTVVKKQIQDHLRKEKLEQLYHDLVTKIDDDISAGVSFIEISKKFGLKVIENKDKARSRNDDVQNYLLDKVFEYNTADGIQMFDHEDKHFIVEITNIKPTQVKTLDIVTDEIKKIILLKKQNIDMKKQVNEISAIIKEGNSLEKLKDIFSRYPDISYKVDRGVKFTRINLPPQQKYNLSTEFLLSTFTLCKKCLSNPEIVGDNKFIIAVPTDVTESDNKAVMYTDEKVKDILYHDFLSYLQKSYKVKIYN